MEQMSKSYYIRGDKENAKRIKAAFDAATEKESVLFLTSFENPDSLNVYDSKTGLFSIIDYPSALADAIMESSHFEELILPELNEAEEKKPAIDKGDIVLYNGGLFRVESVIDCDNKVLCVIGGFVVCMDELKKADHRDEIRILKGGPSND